MKVNINREDVVKNGCSGNCCAAFHLPFTKQELDALKQAVEARKRNKTRFQIDIQVEQEKQIFDIDVLVPLGESELWIDRNGNQRGIPNPKEIEYILDMLIYIGEDTISRETGEDITEEFKKVHPNVQPFDGVYNNMVLRNGKLHGIYYTCKHFDTELKICKEYDKRPTLCRTHGWSGCNYKGCKFINMDEKFIYELGNTKK